MFVCVLVAAAMFGCPQYSVYSARLVGEATLARSNAAKKVLVAQAEAEREAATLRAEAIKIVGGAAKEFPEYRTQEFIGAFADALHSGKIAQIIYVPTEANIPIIEARSTRPKWLSLA
jgi:regulator of protease activity HflC (stomatin/prohibitin superfamily)